jgi:CelD/BcsL family acetyltransferase involved in cellulose biosynthesis
VFAGPGSRPNIHSAIERICVVRIKDISDPWLAEFWGDLSTMPVTFEIDQTLGADALASLWRDLEARAEGSFFLSWDWIGCWIAETGMTPAVLIGRIDGVVVLLGLLVPTRRRNLCAMAIDALHLHTTGDINKDVITIEYNGFLVDRDWSGRIERDAILALLQGVRVGAKRRDELHLKGACYPSMEDLNGTGIACHELSRKPSWRVDLDSVRASGEGYLDHLSANTRQQIRRSIRLYEREGEVKATWATDVDEALRFFDGLKELHQKYWISRGEVGAFAYSFFERFQRRLIATCLTKSTVELIRVSCGQEIVGYLYNFIYRGHVYAYQSGFFYPPDPKYKPGMVCHYLSIEHHLRTHARIYDFMAGDARYKASLGQAGPEMAYFLLQRPTLATGIESVLRKVKGRLRHSISPLAASVVRLGVRRAKRN